MSKYVQRWRIWFAYGLVALMVGCANMKSHDELVGQVHSAQKSGGFDSALKALEASAETEEAKQELLFNLERSELLRLTKRYEDSNKALLLADEKVKQWEDTAKTDPSKLLGMLGAATISERLKPYEGQDYEKVWLTTRLALNRMSAQDWETARVDIKRTHEREAVIAEFRAKEIAAAEAEASEKGVNKTGKTIDGYPVETLDDPEVLNLKNGYQNALSHYLAGFLYEALNEPGLAAPGYRHAIELKPQTPFLEEGLASLDKRTSFTHKARQQKTDVLFLIEAGHAPARKSKAFTLPIPTGRSIRSVSVSYPTIAPSQEPLLRQLMANAETFKLEKIVDLDVMARRVLRDEMPGMVLRNVTRAIVKGVMQDQLERNAGLFGAIVGVVASAATEKADDRMWRMLPERVYLARAYLAPGKYKIQIDDRYFSIEVDISGQYALVPIRLYDQQVVVGEIGRFGELKPPIPVAAPEPVVTPPAPVVKPVKPVQRPKPVPKKTVTPTT